MHPGQPDATLGSNSDVGTLGLPRVLPDMVGLSLVCLVVAYTVWGVARLRQRKPR